MAPSVSRVAASLFCPDDSGYCHVFDISVFGDDEKISTSYVTLMLTFSQVASNRASKRFSTYSGVPSVAASESTISTTNGDPRVQEIKEWSKGLERLNNQRLQQQRYQPTPEKTDNLSKLALGAKVERALGRRMTSQDAVLRPKVLSEKPTTDRIHSTRR